MSTKTFVLDTLRLLVIVLDEPSGVPKDLTGATVEAVVKRPGNVAFAGDASIFDATAGKIRVEFQPQTFSASTYRIQIRVTDIGGDTQTVLNSSIIAARSLVVGEGRMNN